MKKETANFSKVTGLCCPVCTGEKIIYIRELKGSRSNKVFPLYLCTTCYSLFNFSGYLERDENLKADAGYLNRRIERSRAMAAKLITALKKEKPEAQTLLDVGCGVGAIVMEATAQGFISSGIEPNRHAVALAAQYVPDGIRTGYFKRGVFAESFDVIACTHVLEHLERPRELIFDMLENLNKGGLLFISVPFRRDIAQQSFFTLFPRLKFSPYIDSDVHIVHFSHYSMGLLAKEIQARSVKYLCAGYKGYLFQF